METLAAYANAGLEGLLRILAPSTEDPDAIASADPVDDQLRLVALLNSMLKSLLDETADAVGSCPGRATLLALLVEDLARTMGRAQIIATGKLEESDAHTLMEEPLSQIHAAHDHVGEFVAGTRVLPADRCNSPGAKMLFKDATEMAKDQLHLSFAQAKQRITTRDLLVPHRGFNGTTIAPRFAQLAQVFNDCTADPQQVAFAARQMLALQPGIDAQPDPEETAERIEEQVAESLVSRNPAGTAKLLKHVAAKLDAGALEQSEAHKEAHFGLSFKGEQTRGFIWELCTGIEGHELLSSLYDQICNPHSRFGNPQDSEPDTASSATTGEPDAHQPELPGILDGEATSNAAPIPSWAIDPETPPDQIPQAGFSDIGLQSPAALEPPGPPPLAGESLSEARERKKARDLLQYLLDSLRQNGSGDRHSGSDLPMSPALEMIVTIPLDSLLGKGDDPGITGHNHLVSAAYARRLASATNVIPAVLGTESQPLDLGRKQRFFSRAQRRAMLLRDKGCINPGCTMPGHRCEANHIKPWYLGGETDLANGALLCPSCHAAFHAGHFRIVVIKSIPYVVQNKAIDPEQRPWRNWFFHPETQAAA